MGLRVNTNVASLNTQRNLSQVNGRLEGNFRRLATGLRISTAADDAAGLAISERMKAQIRSASQNKRNANDGISFVQTAEGALNEVSNILVRLRELAIQSANGTFGAADQDTLQQEFASLVSEIDRIGDSTEFNGVNLFDGSASTVTFQVGTGVTAGVDTIDVTVASVSDTTLGLDTLDIGSAGDTNAAITAVDTAINSVSSIRGRLGAVQNRLNSTINNIDNKIENISAANSRIRDVDVAFETAELTRNSILQQASISILAQANAAPQSALQLL
ncbi:MAG: flagellin N-terminal helical domain-containing protein [Planctomycetota bacterium]|jgi:flagellin